MPIISVLQIDQRPRYSMLSVSFEVLQLHLILPPTPPVPSVGFPSAATSFAASQPADRASVCPPSLFPQQSQKFKRLRMKASNDTGGIWAVANIHGATWPIHPANTTIWVCHEKTCWCCWGAENRVWYFHWKSSKQSACLSGMQTLMMSPVYISHRDFAFPPSSHNPGRLSPFQALCHRLRRNLDSNLRAGLNSQSHMAPVLRNEKIESALLLVCLSQVVQEEKMFSQLRKCVPASSPRYNISRDPIPFASLRHSKAHIDKN